MARAFDLVNKTNKSKNDCMSIHEFKDILRSHGVFCLDRDVKNLFDRFDKDRDGQITFKDFANEILTKLRRSTYSRIGE